MSETHETHPKTDLTGPIVLFAIKTCIVAVRLGHRKCRRVICSFDQERSSNLDRGPQVLGPTGRGIGSRSLACLRFAS
jgi:hypothetical protein